MSIWWGVIILIISIRFAKKGSIIIETRKTFILKNMIYLWRISGNIFILHFYYIFGMFAMFRVYLRIEDIFILDFIDSYLVEGCFPEKRVFFIRLWVRLTFFVILCLLFYFIKIELLWILSKLWSRYFSLIHILMYRLSIWVHNQLFELFLQQLMPNYHLLLLLFLTKS